MNIWLFPVWAIKNKAFLNISVRAFLWTYFYKCWLIHEKGMAGSSFFLCSHSLLEEGGIIFDLSKIEEDHGSKWSWRSISKITVSYSLLLKSPSGDKSFWIIQLGLRGSASTYMPTLKDFAHISLLPKLTIDFSLPKPCSLFNTSSPPLSLIPCLSSYCLFLESVYICYLLFWLSNLPCMHKFFSFQLANFLWASNSIKEAIVLIFKTRKTEAQKDLRNLRGHPTSKLWFFFYLHYIFNKLQVRELNLDRMNNHL